MWIITLVFCGGCNTLTWSCSRIVIFGSQSLHGLHWASGDTSEQPSPFRGHQPLASVPLSSKPVVSGRVLPTLPSLILLLCFAFPHSRTLLIMPGLLALPRTICNQNYLTSHLTSTWNLTFSQAPVFLWRQGVLFYPAQGICMLLLKITIGPAAVNACLLEGTGTEFIWLFYSYLTFFPQALCLKVAESYSNHTQK